MNEIFESETRTQGDLTGVFEFDGESSYFYLYGAEENGESKILSAIRISVGKPNYIASDVLVVWSANEQIVCLKIRHEIWAAFDCISQDKFGGNYSTDRSPQLPQEILSAFL